MADFTLVITSGASVVDWADPVDGSQPSRLNPHAGHPHKRWLGSVGVPVVISAVVNGVTGPLDGVLGGRLFAAWPVEVPPSILPFAGFGSLPGISSVVNVTPPVVGHYVIGVRRPDGGLEHIHFDVQ